MPIDQATPDPMALELERLAMAAHGCWKRMRDLEGNLRALAARVNAGEQLPHTPLALMLRKHADMLSDRSRDLHEVARSL